MDGTTRAGFLRRLAAFVIDAFVVIGLMVISMVTWVAATVRVLPDTSANMIGLFDATQNVPDLVPGVVFVAYVAASWTAVLGHRSVGMRIAGLQVVRASR